MSEQEPSESKSSGRRWKRLITTGSWANLCLAIAMIILIFGVSERWWLGAAATYAPRGLALLPSVFLVPLSIIVSRWMLGVNLLAVILIAFFAMEFNIPIGGAAGEAAANATPLRIASLNVQRFKPDFDAALAEIGASERDLIVLQESELDKPASLAAHFSDGWHIASRAEYWVASRYPVRYLEEHRSTVFKRRSAAAFEVDHPDGAFRLICVHTSTARHGLMHLDPRKLNIAELNDRQARRATELDAIREFAERIGGERPLILAGDFNLPASSNLWKKFATGFTDAFAARGLGYGYTAPCDGPGPMPSNFPWSRVDHILVNDAWLITAVGVGTGSGSDHRLLSAKLIRRSEPTHRD